MERDEEVRDRGRDGDGGGAKEVCRIKQIQEYLIHPKIDELTKTTKARKQ